MNLENNRTIFIILFVCISQSLASQGDNQFEFRQCLSYCFRNQCSSEYSSSSTSLSYKFLPHWNCRELCTYNCIQNATKLRRATGLSIFKYYGHWPFERHYSLEEPASTIFSLLNCIPHIIHFPISLSKSGAAYDRYYMTIWLQISPIISINAWICSTLYHAKKTPMSTLLDYVSALVLLSYSLWIACRRVISNTLTHSYITILFILSCLCVCYRIHSMIKGEVSYDSHMSLCICISIAHVIVWLYWCLVQYTKHRLKSNNKHILSSIYTCIICQIWFILSAMLELFDFPPIFYYLCDAHSLWHLATVPLGFLWYRFWSLDRKGVEGEGEGGEGVIYDDKNKDI